MIQDEDFEIFDKKELEEEIIIKNNKKRKIRLRTAFTKMSLMAMLLIISTYAWFTSQRDLTLSNLRGTVEVAENMEISLDAKVWHQKIDLSNASVIFEEAQNNKDETGIDTAKAILPNMLEPVSAVGEKNSTIMPVYKGEATGTNLKEIVKCNEADINGDSVDNGYYAFDIYIRNTSQDGEDDTLQLNINSAVKVLARSIIKMTDVNTSQTFIGDPNSGLQNTIRVGLALYNGEVSSTSTQTEILNSTKNATIKEIAIWEPNSPDHVEYIVTNNNKLTDGSGTISDEDLKFEDGDIVSTYALNEAAVAEATITNVYDIASTGLGIQKTFKTEKTTNTDFRIKTTDGKPLDILSISTETDGEGNEVQKPFTITSNTVSRLRVYVWLEGQDVDCINIASEGGGIELDLGLTKDDEIGDIEPTNLLSQIEGNEKLYYGDYTNYPIDLDNQPGTNDWKIFYNDDNHVYLIADDYVRVNKIPESTIAVAKMKKDELGRFGISWTDEVGTLNYTLSNNNYMLSGASEFESTNINYQATATLLDTNLWECFVDENFAISATGAPTLDMFVESWNILYDATEYPGQQIYYAVGSSNGYFVDVITPPGQYTADLKDFEGYNNTLYFPYKEEVEGCAGYRIASPVKKTNTIMFVVHRSGKITNTSYFWDSSGALRPIVCLDTNVKAIRTDGVWEFELN